MTDDGDLDIEGWDSLGQWCGGDRCWRGQESVGWCLGIGAEEIAFGVTVVGIEGWARISVRVAG